MTAPTAGDAWQPGLADRHARLLEQTPLADGARAIGTSVHTDHGEVDLILDALGQVGLMIPTGDSVPRSDQRSSSVVVQAVDHPTGQAAFLVCRDAQLVDHFLRICDEVLATIVLKPQASAEVAASVLADYRDLLKRSSSERMGEAELAGLFGELSVLVEVLASGGRVEHWTAAHPDAKDFRLPGLSIEVKSTLSANFRRVTVHGLNQLADPSDGSRFVLLLQRLERSPTGGSVPDMIERLQTFGVADQGFDDLLADRGYLRVHEHEYRRFRFSSREIELHEVETGFPRLTEETFEVPPGLNQVVYELDLAAAGRTPLQDSASDLIEAVDFGPES